MDERLVKAINDENRQGVIDALEEGADPNKMTGGITPLARAIGDNHSKQIIQALLSKGANPNAQDPGGTTPLMLAVARANMNALERLFAVPTLDIDKKDYGNGRTALFYSKSADVTAALIEHGADVTEQDATGRTPYIHAIYLKLYHICDQLVESGMEAGFTRDEIVNQTDSRGRNAAFYPTHPLGVDQIKMDGVKLDEKNEDGITPLLFFITSKFVKDGILLKLIDYGANVNAENPADGMTPIYFTAAANNLRVTEKLLERGADVNHQSSNGTTPLMIAAQEGHEEIVYTLIEVGANISLKNAEGKTAYDLATNERVKELLVPKPMWMGLTQTDASLFDTFFEDKINYSCCPICLAYTQRSSACRYMTHDCTQQVGVIRHRRLYDLYKNEEGDITWCTVCGRPCRGHRHYQLAPHESPAVPALSPLQTGLNVFGGEADCIKDGGGGVAEKVKRLDRMRAWAKELQSEVGKITEEDARRQLVEEAWNAPLSRAPTARILEEGKFTVPATDFPAPAAPAPAAAPAGPAPDIPKPADEVANVPEIVAEGGMDSFELDDIVPAVRFVHKKKDGTVYRHTDEQLIGRNGLTNFIRSMNGRFGTEEFGLCFALPDCDAKLWPQDVKDIVDDQAVYEEYRQKFNEKFKVVQGGAGKPLFVLATGVKCALPEKKAGTYRRRRRQVKKTRRNKFTR